MRVTEFSIHTEQSLYGPRQANLVLITYASSQSRGTFRQKARSLAPLNGWACAVKICRDGMLEDTNSLDGAHIFFFLHALHLTIVYKLGYALSILHWNKYIFDQEMFGWLLSTTSWHPLNTPWYKTEISRTGENRGKSCQVCKKIIPSSVSAAWDLLFYAKIWNIWLTSQSLASNVFWHNYKPSQWMFKVWHRVF